MEPDLQEALAAWRKDATGPSRDRVASALHQLSQQGVRTLGVPQRLADDVVQETTIRLLKWLEDGNTPQGSGSSLVRLTARNVWVSMMRRTRREVLTDTPADDVADDAVDDVDQDALLEVTALAMDALSTGDRSLLRRVYGGGETIQDLAEEELQRRGLDPNDEAASKKCRAWADKKVQRARNRLRLAAHTLAQERGLLP